MLVYGPLIWPNFSFGLIGQNSGRFFLAEEPARIGAAVVNGRLSAGLEGSFRLSAYDEDCKTEDMVFAANLTNGGKDQ